MLKLKLVQSLSSFIQRFEKSLFVLAGAASLTALLLNLDFSLLEANLYDLRAIRGHFSHPESKIVLVTLDDTTTKALDEYSPLPLDAHAQFLESMERLQPRAIGYLVDLNQVNQINPELFQKEPGTRFLDAARRLEQNGTIVLLGTPYDVTGEVLPPFPLSSLPHSVAIIHKDGNVFAEDKITRRALTRLNDKPVFHLDLAQRLGAIGANEPVRGAFSVKEIDSEYFFFRYHGDTSVGTSSADWTPYTRVSFIDILNHRLPDGALRGKVVLVGTLSKDNSSDFTFTPYSKASFSNPKILVHANILDSLIHHEGIIRAPAWINWLTTFVVITLVFTWVVNFTPLYGVFMTLALAAIFTVLGQIAFQWRGLWIRESQPLVGIFLGYYLVVPYRLIREYKQRWDYQRKNEVLTQVEELKRNFLSLVTHDLKTPVARIQGLAEVLMRSKVALHFEQRDHEAVSHIISSTEELNSFISSILELSKIESNRLKLNLESKDINQLIERVVDGFSAQARSMRIKIVTLLEPIFPIKLDASLISKVLNNLIDNALKYSPENSEIRVVSRDLGTWVEISVHDEGIGMSPDERAHLFTRFYRAKNDATSKVRGTGLGLYLTKFFVKAHQGRVEVDSKKGEGSTFKILLPMGLSQGLTKSVLVDGTPEKEESSYV